MAIEKAAVLGAGVMGAQIAAHFANAGIPVQLLDVVPKGADNRNALAEGAVACSVLPGFSWAILAAASFRNSS